MTTNILALADAPGSLVRFVPLPAHRFDTVGAAPLIENLLCKLKEFERVAMRAGETIQSFKASIYLAAAAINSR
jgi:hypothetical protein